jgi:putative MATE family efflux protein
MNSAYDLTAAPVPQILRRLAVPVGIGFFFNTMFNVVDTFYAGLISTQALAAMSLSFPVFFLIIAVGSGIATGATALIGHALGAGLRDEARGYATQAVTFAAIHGALMTVAGLAAAPALFRVLGASEEYLLLALAYINAIFAGSTCFILNQSLNASLNATGNTKCFRNFLVVGFFLNLGLDPWFLYGGFGLPAMGLAGVAWATVVVQAVGNVYLAMQVKKSGLVTGARPRDFLPRKQTFIALAKQGFPASLNMLTVALGIFVITWFLGRFGREAVAAYGIATRIEQLVLLPVMGLNVATLALVAQNSGAGLVARVRETVRTAISVGVLMMAAGGVAVYVTAERLMRLFTADSVVVAIGADYLHVAAFVFGAYVILYVSVFALQGLKRPLFAVVIGSFRQFIAPIPLFIFLSSNLGLGIMGIWWGIGIITWSAALISLFYVRSVLRLLPEAGRV